METCNVLVLGPVFSNHMFNKLQYMVVHHHLWALKSRFGFWFYSHLSLWPRPSLFTSLSLGFLICEVKMTTAASSCPCLKRLLQNSINMVWGFPGGKESACNAGDTGDLGLISGLGRSPGGGNGNPRQYSYLENSMDRGACWATVLVVTKSWTQLINWAHRWELLFIFVSHRYSINLDQIP